MSFPKAMQAAKVLQGQPPVGSSSRLHGRRGAAVGVALLLTGATGCRSHFIDARVMNDRSTTVHVVEIDYPGASFGVSTLAPHTEYHYRFKLLGSGPLAISYTDDKGEQHAATGPTVKEGQQGGLTVHLEQAGTVRWAPSLSPP